MKNVWVYKFDGTIQCDTIAKPIPLEAMRVELELCAGADNVLAMKRTERYMPTMCGLPTGAANAYELTPTGYFQLNHGIVPNPGFMLLEEAREKAVETESLGQVLASLMARNPHAIRDLPGHPVRVYQTGDALTKDLRPDRFNLEHDDARRIVSVWFG